VSAPGAGYGPIGDVRLLPAPDAALRPLPWHPSHAIAICEMHMTPGTPPLTSLRTHDSNLRCLSPCPPACQPDTYLLASMQAGTPWEACPRTALKRVLARAEREHGITFSIGYESEFILLQRPASPATEGMPPGIDCSVYCSSRAYNDAATGASHAMHQGCEARCSHQRGICMHG
jgi:glutamine synthetase